jgi:hypothetical protein
VLHGAVIVPLVTSTFFGKAEAHSKGVSHKVSEMLWENMCAKRCMTDSLEKRPTL